MLVKKETTRREFLEGAMRLGICLSSASFLWDVVMPGRSSAEWDYREVKWYRRVGGDKVQCEICPKNCLLEHGQTCFCRTRTNVNGKLVTAAWNNPSVIEIAKIESAPLYHYSIGSEFLAIGASGCNLRCEYCQNFNVSQRGPGETRNYRLDGAGAASAAMGKALKGVLFTFTEPTAYLEYLMSVAERARSGGLGVAVATSGYLNKGALKDAARHVDAFAVTLKGFSDDFYRRVCDAELTPVLRAMETIRDDGRWLEVVNLIVPTLNDSPAEIREMSGWIRSNLGPDTPLHFARFSPAYRMKGLRETTLASLEGARGIALEAGLRYVYVTNVPGHPGGDTYCPGCGRAVINRMGFDVVKKRLQSGKCGFCGTEMAGRFIA